MFKIQQSRSDLALQFKQKPLGPYSDELLKVLHVMRWQQTDGKRAIICIEPGKKWCIGILNTQWLKPIETDESQTFDNLKDCYWDIFKHRWKDHTGEFPDINQTPGKD